MATTLRTASVVPGLLWVRLAAPVLVAGIPWLATCGGTDILPAPVARVEFLSTYRVMVVGDAFEFIAEAYDANGAPLFSSHERTFTWTSSNPLVAAVSQQGIVTALSAGEAQIEARIEGKSGSAALLVLIPVASLTVTPDSLSLRVGQSDTLTATVKDAAGNVLSGRAIMWYVLGYSFVTVTDQGVVTAGNYQALSWIVAWCEGKGDTATVFVTP